MVPIIDSLSDIANPNDGEDWDDADGKKIEEGQLSDDDEPGWVMGTIIKTVQQEVETFRKKDMKLDELTQPEWEDAADDFRERDKQYRTSELSAPTAGQLQTHHDAAAPALSIF